MRSLLLAVVLSLSSSCAFRGEFDGGALVVYSAPPEPIIEEYHDDDGRIGLFWVEGHWARFGYEWRWVPGHWEHTRCGWYWEDGRWVRRGGAWHWVPGRWVPRSHGPFNPGC